MTDRIASQDRVDLDRLARWFTDTMPEFTSEERALGAEVYRQLLAGEPIPLELLAEKLGWSKSEVERILDQWAPYDEDKRVIGFWGLTLQPTRHSLEVSGQRLYGYCAWDTLFVPELLGQRARIESTCPETGATIRLLVGPGGVEEVEPAGTVVSFLTPDLSELMECFGSAETLEERKELHEKAIASFCHYIFFFESVEAAEQWTARHPGTFIISLDDAFALGKRANAGVFKGMRAATRAR